ncbi:MAG: hypothetical protein QM783_10570 [Phycisphaerales bacterium]
MLATLCRQEFRMPSALRTFGFMFAVTLMTAAAMAQPRFWATGRVRGTTPVGTPVAQFENTVDYDMEWGAFYTVIDPSTASALAPRTGTETGTRVAKEVMQRGYLRSGSTPDPNLALYITRFGLRGLTVMGRKYDPSQASHDYPNDPTYPALYCHAGDLVTYTSGGQVRTNRGIWMRNGINATQSWVDAFVASYNTTRNGAGQYAAIPSRVIFDQEIDFVLGDYRIWTDVLAYWGAVSAALSPTDPNYATPLPGGTQTLAALWAAASISPPGPAGSDPNLVGGTAANHEWYRWWCGVEQRVLGGAIKEAFIDRAALQWPGVKGIDYGATIKTLGVVPITDLAYLGGAWTTPEDRGFSYSVDQDLSNSLNNLVLYLNSNSSLWEYFRVKSPNPQGPPEWTTSLRWRNTDDQGTPMYGLVANGFGSPRITPDDQWSQDGDEFLESSSLRMRRHALDLCLRKNAGTVIGGEPTTPITAFITLPTQTFTVSYGARPQQGWALKYDGLTATDSFPVRQSTYGTYRLLASCRTRGVNELIVWSETSGRNGPSGSTWNNPDIFHLGVEPDFDRNWTILRRAANQVYEFDTLTASAFAGTFSLPSGTTAASCLRLADEGVPGETLGSRSAAVTSPVGSHCSMEIVFQRTRPQAAPQFLNFELEVIPDLPGVVRFPTGSVPTFEVWIFNYSLNQYQLLNNVVANPQLKDQDARSWLNLNASATFRSKSRLTIRVPYSPSLVSSQPGVPQQSKIYIRLSPTTGFSSKLMVDSAICYGSDDNFRFRCDLNGDGLYDGADLAMYNTLRANPGPGGASGWRLIDFNNDGVLNGVDDALWEQMTGHYDLSPETSPGFKLMDDHRQVGSDPRDPPPRPLP